MSNSPEELLIQSAIQLVENTIPSFFTGVKNLAKKGLDQVTIKTGRAFKEYFDTTIKKYSNTKTILYRFSPHYLYDFYEDIELIDKENTITLTDNIHSVLLNGDKIVITGLAGSGKSLLMRHLFLRSISQKAFLPVLIELRNINNIDLSFEKFIFAELKKLNFDLEEKLVIDLLHSGKFLILLDGFDEIDHHTTDRIAFDILEFSTKFHKNKFILSSRPGTNFVGWNAFNELKIYPFNEKKCISLVNKLEFDTLTKENFLKELDNGLFDRYSSFLSNPLLATIMLMTYDHGNNLPTRLHEFYSQAFDVLYYKHDATKTGYKRLMHTLLGINNFEKVFSAFCIQTYIENEFYFHEKDALEKIENCRELVKIGSSYKSESFLLDLTKSLCLLLLDGTQYTFTHRSFQEYFSAVYISRTEPKKRKGLLKHLESKMLIDNTFMMAYELDRGGFDNDYLIPRLEEIEKNTSYKKESERESFKNFLLQYIEVVRFTNGGIVTFIPKQKEMNTIFLLLFIQKISIIGSENTLSASYGIEITKEMIAKILFHSDESKFEILDEAIDEVEKNHLKNSKFEFQISSLNGLQLDALFLEKKFWRNFWINYSPDLFRLYLNAMKSLNERRKEQSERESLINKILFNKNH